MAVVVLVVTMILLQCCSPSGAQLNPVDAAALFDLCAGTNLWSNCSDSVNACINIANWSGISCDNSTTSVVVMYDLLGPPRSSSRASTTLISSWLCIRSRYNQSTAGGSLPASIGNLSQLQELCDFFCIHLVNSLISLQNRSSLTISC